MTTDYKALRTQLNGLAKELGGRIPDAMGAFGQLHKTGLAEGALEKKTKELIALGIAITTHCQGCIAFHVHDALKAGASEAEVADAIGVAILMGGGPAMIYGCEALEALKQFSAS